MLPICKEEIKKAKEMLDEYAEYCAVKILSDDWEMIRKISDEDWDDYLAALIVNYKLWHVDVLYSWLVEYPDKEFHEAFGTKDVYYDKSIIGQFESAVIMLLGSMDELMARIRKYNAGSWQVAKRRYAYYLIAKEIAKKAFDIVVFGNLERKIRKFKNKQ